MVGAAQRFALHAASGALVPSGAALDGAAQHIVVHDAAGDLAAALSVVAGGAHRSGAGAADPADVWGYVLANGLTAGQTLVELHARIVLNTPPTDVNVQWVNGVLIHGTGAPPDHWRPA